MSSLIYEKAKVASDYYEESNKLHGILNLSATVPNMSHQMLEFRRKSELQSKKKSERIQYPFTVSMLLCLAI